MGKMTRVLCALVAGAMLVGLIGCNTVRGAGRDVERAGEKVQDVAR